MELRLLLCAVYAVAITCPLARAYIARPLGHLLRTAAMVRRSAQLRECLLNRARSSFRHLFGARAMAPSLKKGEKVSRPDFGWVLPIGCWPEGR